jgi:aldose 1-epimerase
MRTLLRLTPGWVAGLALAASLSGCGGSSTEQSRTDSTSTMQQPTVFGTTTEGDTARLYTLTNGTLTARITTYGGIVTHLMVPDKAGTSGDVALGFDSLSAYIKDNPFFGALVGRYGNRIAKGQFVLDGQTYTLAKNNGPNHLHGGRKGFDKVVWDVLEADDKHLKLRYVSADGEEGYPGELTTTVTYTVTNDNALKIDYEATTTKKTPVNLTNHSYFNLSAGTAKDILNHEMMIDADRYTVVDATLIPTGELRKVDGTPMDFRKAAPIGSRIKQVGGDPVGYDHNYVLNRPDAGMRKVVEVYEPTSGRVMDVSTDQPGVQFYSGNFLNGKLTGKNGQVYGQYAGFCLETQHFPDSPNQKAFPSTILNPGETYRTSTEYKFSTR